MGSKKLRKAQNGQDLQQLVTRTRKKKDVVNTTELLSETPTLRKHKRNNHQSQAENIEEEPETIISTNETPKTPKEKKSKKKNKQQILPVEQIEENNTQQEDSIINENEIIPKKKSKKKHNKPVENIVQPEPEPIIEIEEPVKDIIDKQSSPKKEKRIIWSVEDQTELVQRMESCIPEGDHLRFKSRVAKLDWDKVTFKEYTVQECQTVWGQLEKQVRGYRILLEVLEDAKKIIRSPPKIIKHADMPKLPPTAFSLFSHKKKEKIASENPNLDPHELSKLVMQTYKNLPPEKREKYEKQAAKHKEEYKEKLDEFYTDHPEIERPTKRLPKKDVLPKRPTTPFSLFYLSELNSHNIPDVDKTEFKEKCKEKWKAMSDKKKINWITLAEEQYRLYEDNLKNYMTDHPDYVPQKMTKPFLNRSDVLIKDRLAGKPKKPPTSAYAFFTSLQLQTEEKRQMPIKERLSTVSTEWKNLPEDEKNHYKTLWGNMMDEYKKNYDAYLSSLPEDQRLLEMQNASTKKRRNTEDTEQPVNNKKKKIEKPQEDEVDEENDDSIQQTKSSKKLAKVKANIKGPKRPQTPFGLYYLSELQKTEVPESEKQNFKMQCKATWQQLSDKKKIPFITEAQEKHNEYEKLYKKFVSAYPQLANQKFTKSVLSKQELVTLERASGKPSKPPKSVYSYFASIHLLKPEIKQLPTKERLSHVSVLWREMPDDEKNQYKEQWMTLMEQYKKDFKAYLANLPEEKRQQELKNLMPTKNKKLAEAKAKTNKKKAVLPRKKVEKTLKEPEQPPISDFSYFTQCYKGNQRASDAWKALSPEEKKTYHQELVAKKQEYIKEFERFLRSLTKDQLEEFSKQRMKNGNKKNAEEENEDDNDDEDLMEQYKKDFKAYLANLPEEKRQQELKNLMPTKNKKLAEAKAKTNKKKAVLPRKKVEKTLKEPEQPPISDFSYFTQCYKGNQRASDAWKALSPEEKKTYHQELVAKKQEYIKEFERFLRSLTKDQLEEFSKQRMKNGNKKNAEEENEDDNDDEDENSEDEESEEDDVDDDKEEDE